MTFEQFESEIQRLEWSIDKQVSDERMKMMFEVFEEWSAYKLKKVVDHLIRNLEKAQFPTIQQIIKVGDGFLDNKNQKERVIDCDLCEGRGYLRAEGKDGYKCLFRCNNTGSHASDDRYANIQLWGKEAFEKGWRLERDFKLKPLDPENPEDFSGVKFMKENSPKTYLKFLKDNPSKASLWEEKLSKVRMPDLEIQKEIEREISLRQDFKRDAPKESFNNKFLDL